MVWYRSCHLLSDPGGQARRMKETKVSASIETHASVQHTLLHSYLDPNQRSQSAEHS